MIAFYCDNHNFSAIEIPRPLAGNPGIGGTPFMQIAVPALLRREYPSAELHIFAPRPIHGPPDLPVHMVDDPRAALAGAQALGCRNLVVNATAAVRSAGFREAADRHGVGIIPWLHNHAYRRDLLALGRLRHLHRVVVLGWQQLSFMRWWTHARRCVVIPHPTLVAEMPKQRYPDRVHRICYAGGMSPQKGLHLLLRAWPWLARRHPDLELDVIGGSRIYGDTLPTSEYERRIRAMVEAMDEPSRRRIRFHGACGSERFAIMREADIGVFNPSGNTETFGIVGVEFQALGVPVVSIRRYSAIDIIAHARSGWLFARKGQLAATISMLVEDPALCERLGRAGPGLVQGLGEPRTVAARWAQVLDLEPEPDPLPLHPRLNPESDYSGKRWYRLLSDSGSAITLAEATRRLANCYHAY